MLRRNAMQTSTRAVLLMTFLLCAVAMLVGCAQQSQTTSAADSSAQSQTASAQASSTQAEPAASKEEQEEANAIAKVHLDAAAVQEPTITQDLQAYEDDQAKLVSLDHRFKSQESLARKILLNAHTEEISLEEAADDINDVLRYTMVIEPSVYVSKATDMLKGLEAKGYSVVQFKNKWGGDLYKGLNTLIKAPTDIVFELQFHTPDSYAVYDQTHKYYEIARAEDSTKEQVEEANSKRRELNAGLAIPEGALEFTWE